MTTGPKGLGHHRRVVGAHYGLKDWMAQRATAVVLALYLLLLLCCMALAERLDYDGWAGIFAAVPMKLATVVAVCALAWHAWIGMRDIWMDYVTVTKVRLALQFGTILWLVYCLVWTVQILWKV